MRVISEDLGLLRDEPDQGLIHRPLRDQPVGIDLTRLAHASHAGDGLTFGRGLELGLHQDDDLGALEVDAHAAGFDLQGDDPEAFQRGEAVDDLLTFLGADRPVDLRTSADELADLVEDLTEERKDDDLTSVVAITFEQIP